MARTPQKRPWFGGSAAPLNRGEISHCRDLLNSLASELREAEPVAPRGVALVEYLLHDGHSPLYYTPATTERGLAAELRRAKAALLLR